MAKYCRNCGTELNEGVKFCSKCGTKIENIGSVNQSTYNESNQVLRREIAISVILSIVTCGIYSIYWFVVMTDDVNKVSNENGTSGTMAFVFSLLTCGIYMYFWSYKMGKQMHEAGSRNGIEIADNSILYLVLSLFGLGIVNYCLIQNDLNRLAN
ncbi:MAG: DUF4234 domain-containing protein [Bacilli bacterium]|nr:DUF4234 domain-containing protein [Bacilli bacterium]